MDCAVELGFALQEPEVLFVLAGRGQQTFDHQLRCGMVADLGMREKHLRAPADGEAPNEQERTKRPFGSCRASGHDGTLCRQQWATGQRRTELPIEAYLSRFSRRSGWPNPGS